MIVDWQVSTTECQYVPYVIKPVPWGEFKVLPIDETFIEVEEDE